MEVESTMDLPAHSRASSAAESTGYTKKYALMENKYMSLL